MSLCVSLTLQDANILIVGGGKMAVKKSRVFLKEGAHVFVAASSLQEGFDNLSITWMAKAYEASLLSGMMMVVACSGDEGLNAQICEDARRAGILAMSVTECQQASVHALAQVQNAEYELALGTRGASPYLAKEILHTYAKQLDATYKQRFWYLRMLRGSLKQRLEESLHKSVFTLLADFPEKALKVLLEAMDRNTIVLFCFHGVKKDANRELEPFLRRMRETYETPCGIAYLSEDVAAQSEEVALSAWMEILHALKLSVQLVPMLFQDGRFLRQCQQYENPQVALAPLFFQDSHFMQTALTKLREQLDCTAMVVIYHSSMSGGFAKVMQEVMTIDKNLFALHEKQEEYTLPYRNQRVCVLPLYMLKGTHYAKDAKEESPLCQRLLEQGCDVVMEKRSCVEMDVFLKRIQPSNHQKASV